MGRLYANKEFYEISDMLEEEPNFESQEYCTADSKTTTAAATTTSQQINNIRFLQTVVMFVISETILVSTLANLFISSG